MSSGSSE